MRAARTAWIVLILVAVAAMAPAQDRTDVVLLRNGMTVEGLLLEQSPGNYLLLTTGDGSLAYITSVDLLHVDHGAGELLPDQYEDILLLRSGLIFRGTVREDAPGRHVVLELAGAGDDGRAESARVTVPYADLWKIIRRPVLPPDDPDAARSVRSEAITLKLEITLGSRRADRRTGTGDDSAVLDTLTDELAEIEESRLLQEVADCESRHEDEREDIQSTADSLEEAIDELAALAAICEEGPTRSKGDDPSVPGLDPESDSAGRLDPTDGEPTSYERWSLQDVTGQLHADSVSLADQAASPAGDPATLAALRERFETRAQVTRLIAPRTGTNPLQLLRINRNASSLPLPDRELLYRANHRQDQLLGVGLNVLPVLNLGSWLQGDLVGAVANTAFMAVGGAVIWAGFAYADHFAPQETEIGVLLLPSPMTTVWAGTAIMAAAYVSSLVRPFWYDHRCNRLLADALDVRP